MRRTRPDFWNVFHDLTRYVQQTDPIEAGLFDLSRYENLQGRGWISTLRASG